MAGTAFPRPAVLCHLLSLEPPTLTHLDSAVLCAWTVTSDTLLVVTILEVHLL